ncbi:hypothetical protein TNCT_538771 [Trichonephila clavata]|uniref:Uncharacterized protein n=1 Tax=Trichonephila clavata TaxID=2740835 RepID=A0A8X6LFH1_TRICU|nr:hypothetical protein TNCT_538771 [Trichonephila clavata]
MPSFIEILIFEMGMEIAKSFYFNHHCISEIGFETKLSLAEMVWTIDPGQIPQVHSPTVYAICKAQELRAELVPLQDNNQQLTPIQAKKAHKTSTPPAVYSFTVFKMCRALDLEAELHPRTQRPIFVIKNSKSVPVVRSLAIFSMCQALHLDAQLANN